MDVYPHKYEYTYKQGHTSSYQYWNNYYTGIDNRNFVDDDYDDYVNEYNDMEQIISDNYEYVMDIPNGEIEIAAKQLIDDYGFKHLNTSEVAELLNFYRG